MSQTSPAITRRTKVILAGTSVFVALFAVIVIPNFIRAHTTLSENGCINNLRLIEGAKEQWALGNNKTTNDIVTWEDIRPYLGRGMDGKLPTCSHGGTYVIGKIGETPRCCYPGDSIE